MSARATSACGRGQRSLLARALRVAARTAFALVLATAAGASALAQTQVVNTASVTWGPAPQRTTLSNQVLVQVSAPAQLAVSVASSRPQSEPGQDVRFDVRISAGATPPAPTTTSYRLDGVPGTVPYVLAPVPVGSTFTQVTASGSGLVYHWAGDPATTLHTTTPPAGGQVDAVGILLSQVPANGTSTYSMTVTPQNTPQVYQGGVTLQVQPAVVAGIGAGSSISVGAPARTVVMGAASMLSLYADSALTVPVNSLLLGHTGFLKLDAPACNDNSATAVTRTATLTTASGDAETITVTQSAPGSSIFTMPPLNTVRAAALPGDGKLESPTSTQGSVAIGGCYAPVNLAFQLIDPQGTVFDSRSDSGVDDMAVTLYRASAGSCTRELATAYTYDPLGALVPAPNPSVSKDGGRYEFPLVQPGFYCLGVTSNALHTFPSQVPFAQMSAQRLLQPASIGSPFELGPGAAPVLVDLPVDATSGQYVLFVEKKTNAIGVVVGEQVDFTITVKNTGSDPVRGVKVSDTMSAGLGYVAGTARINAAAAADPQVLQGSLMIPLPDLAAGASATLTYRAAVGPAAQRTVRNSASATANAGVRSNVASVALDVSRGFETDNKGVLTGTVSLACKDSDAEGNPGVPGVTLLIEDGTSVTTDRNGRFSLYAVHAGTHALKVDRSTLPAGSRLLGADARGLVLVDLKDGELFKRNFVLECTPSAKDESAERASRLMDDEAFRVLDRVFAPTVTAVQPAGSAPSTLAAGVASGSPGSVAPALAMPSAVLPAAAGARLTEEQRAVPPATAAAARSGVAAITPPAPVTPSAPASPQPLEVVLPSVADNRAGFLMPADGQVLPSGVTLVRVKAPAGSELELLANGEPVSAKQVGKRAVLADRQLIGADYVAVKLRPGPNTLALVVRDPWGNTRGRSEITVTAPGGLASLVIEPVEQPLYAGDSPYAKVRIRSLDADGLPVTTRIPVQLEASGGQWALPSGELAAHGQAFLENGSVELSITRPKDPTRVNVDASIGPLHGTAVLDFVPRLRPLIGAGVLEGIVRFTGGQMHAVLPTSSLDAFSQELRGVSRELGGNSQLGARAAVYLKGKVKGDYLLTLAYDSDKTTQDRLFRDISPDEFYPVYGDSSVRQFDAQSVSKLYVRIDKGHDWLLVGDFMTQPAQGTGPRPVLSAYSRPVNGAAAHYERGPVAVEGFALRDATRQQVVEIAPNGTSGPYTVATAGLLANSERVEILVRDRIDTNIILRRTTLTRFQDYELEALAGRVLFSAPVAMFDDQGNPQTVRVTYETEGNGDSFTTAGGQVSMEVAAGVAVAGRMVRENNPASPYTLQGVLVDAQVSPALKISAELARSSRGGEPLESGKAPGTGMAARVDVRGKVGAAEVAVTATSTGTNFENSAAGSTPGHRDVLATASLPVTESTRAVGKVTLAEDTRTGAVQEAAYVGTETAIGSGTSVEAGARVLHQSQAAAPVPAAGSGDVDTTSLRIKATTQLASVPNLRAWVEGEQAVAGQGRMVGVGTDYQLTPTTKVYGRTELVNTMPVLASSAATHQATAVGIDASYSATGRAYGELRETVSQGASAPAAAYGVREGWEPWKGVRLTGGLERVQALGTPVAGVGDSVALTSSARIQLSDAWRANARAERSIGTGTQSTLLTTSAAYKFDEHWSGLARQVFFEQTAADGSAPRIQSRVQAGAAWRSVRDDALVVGETRREPVDGGEKDSDIVSAQYGRALSTTLRASARIAGRFSRLRSNGLDTTSSAVLAGTRFTLTITRDVNVGLNIQAVRGSDGQGFSLGTGIEAGYRVTEGLWMVVGYDFARVRDNILQGPGAAHGAFIRARYIFDETALDLPEPK